MTEIVLYVKTIQNIPTLFSERVFNSNVIKAAIAFREQIHRWPLHYECCVSLSGLQLVTDHNLSDYVNENKSQGDCLEANEIPDTLSLILISPFLRIAFPFYLLLPTLFSSSRSSMAIDISRR